MKKLFVLLTLLLTLASSVFSQPFRGGYLPSWSLNTTGMPTIPSGTVNNGNYGNMPYSALDLYAFDYIIMFAYNFQSDGTIAASNGNMVTARQKPFNDYVKQTRDIPVLISFGGSTGGGFPIGTPALRTTSAKNLMTFMRTNGYKGWDCDMEPVNSGDTLNLRLFLQETYDSCKANGFTQTVAAYNFPAFWGRIKNSYDILHHMTYDFYGTWLGKGWHNNAIYTENGNYQVGTSIRMNSVQVKAEDWLQYIPKEKYSPGVDFNGYVWRGGRDANGQGIISPRQVWVSAPTQVGSSERRGWQIYRDYISRYPSLVRFDNIAKVPYIGIDSVGYANDYYVTYEDTTTVKEFVNYCKTQNFGGGFIWEIGGGYYGASDIPNWTLPRDFMVQAWKRAWGTTPPVIFKDTIPPTISFVSPSNNSIATKDTSLITVNASDNVGVSKIEFTVNGTMWWTEYSAPYVFPYAHKNIAGTKTIVATAFDTSGNTKSATLQLIVNELPIPCDTAGAYTRGYNAGKASIDTVRIFNDGVKSVNTSQWYRDGYNKGWNNAIDSIPNTITVPKPPHK